MKRQLLVLLLALVLALSIVACVACVDPQPEQPTRYDLTYSANGGGGAAPAAEQHEAGAKVTLKAANTFTAPEGKEFDGWLIEGTKLAAGAEYTMPAKAVTATAQWKNKETPQPQKYTVTYDAGEGSGAAPAVEQYEEGEEFTLKAADTFTAPEGKEFDGWLVDGETSVREAGTKMTMFPRALTITAQWKTSEPKPEKPDVTLYFYNSDGWEAVNAYAWIGDDKLLGEWPGSATTAVADQKGWVKAVVKADLATDDLKVIFNNGQGGAGNQTADMTVANAQNVYFINAKTDYAYDSFAAAEAAINPPQPVIPANAQIVIEHNADTTEGQLVLFGNGNGYIYIANKSSGIAFVENYVTYTINEGVLTIATAPDSKLTVPATGTISGRTVSITLENTSSIGAKLTYKFESEVYKLTVNYGFENQQGVSSVEKYIPAGMTDDFTRVEREGYTLKVIKANGEAVSLDAAKNLSMPKADVTISYEWEAVQAVSYTVTYKAGEGTGEDYVVTATSASYKLLNTVDAKEKFSREGWSLVGWTVNGEEKAFGATITLTGDTVVIARYRQTFTVEFAGLDASGVSKSANFDTVYPEDERYSEVTKLTLPSSQAGMFVAYVTRSGFNLTGWVSSADNQTYVPGAQVAITQNTTFTAVWELKHVASATEFEGTWTSEQGLAVGDSGNVINRITIAGDVISGDISGTITVSEGVATVEALGVTYTLIISDNGTLVVSAKRLNSTYTGTFTKLIPTDKTLADFQGHWIGTLALRNNPCAHIEITGTTLKIFAEQGTQTYALTEDKTDRNLVATYTGGNSYATTTITLTFTSDNQFTIVYDKKAATEVDTDNKTGTFTKAAIYDVTFSLGEEVEGTAPAAQQIIESVGSQKATKPADPEREGWTFLGWFNGETEFDFTADVTASVALTAKWEQITEVTVTFDLNNQYATSLTAPVAQTIAYDAAATAPEALELAGWSFGGWATSASSKTAFDFATTLKKNTTLYAIWSKVYAVTYSINGETETKQNVSSVASELFYDLDEGFPTGYTLFLGWKSDIQGDAVIHYSGESEFIQASVNEITLTAVFGAEYTRVGGMVPAKRIIRNDANQFAVSSDIHDADGWIAFTVVGEGDEAYGEYVDASNSALRFFLGEGTYKASDMLRAYSAKTNDAAATLTFDGFGQAMLDGHKLSYTFESSYYYSTLTLIVSEDVMYEDLDIEFDYNANTISFDARIKIGDDTYLFGNAPQEWTVTFELGEGVTGEVPEAITVLSNNANITLPDGTGLTNENEELEFKGWIDKNGDGTTVLKGAYTVTGNITLVSVWGEAGGESLTLADFIGTSSSAAVNYGYSSLDEADTNKLDVTNSSGTLYDLFKLQFYSTATGIISGNRYHGANRSAGITLYASQDTSGAKASATSSADDTYYISVSGIWCSIVFEKNVEGVRSIKVTNLSTNISVTWTEIVSA